MVPPDGIVGGVDDAVLVAVGPEAGLALDKLKSRGIISHCPLSFLSSCYSHDRHQREASHGHDA